MERLVEASLLAGESQLAAGGALVVRTGQFTGRSPGDKFVVRDALTESTVDWGSVNQPMTPEQFASLLKKVQAHLAAGVTYIHDGFGGADPHYTLPIRVVTQFAWHALFAHQLFLRGAQANHAPQFTLYFAPTFETKPERDGTKSSTCIAIDFTRRAVIICGTEYAGEMKKSVFTILNHLLPDRDVFPMHCSANRGLGGDTALFFGLSGTGKTTLSADPHRRLIGDDEHGWSPQGIFNFEGGCYAKCIKLSKKNEPEIWNAIRFGTVLENVKIDAVTRVADYDSSEYTENTRAAYPVDFIEGALIPGVGGHPKTIILLTADAFGVLPPVSKLTPDQAMYHFLSGYTAKVAGTERGLSAEPSATFSQCFGSPFMTRPARAYAEMLGARLRQHEAHCYLVNTGWVGGAFGVGERMKLPFTRAMITAALSGVLANVETKPHPVFGIHVPVSCPDVPTGLLDARRQWADGAAYDAAAADLSARFRKNFAKFGDMPDAIRDAGPK